MTTWFLAGAALKCSVVLLAAWAAAGVLRRRSAAARHLIWTAAAAAVASLPFLSIGLPALRLAPAVEPSSPAGIVFQVFATFSPDSAGQASGLPSTAPVHRGAAALPSAGGFLPWIWACGTAASLFQMSFAYARLWRRRRTSSPFDHRGLVSDSVPLLEAPQGSMPIAFGFFRPSIFLPAEANQWSDERLRVVLLHELAHIRRGDPAMHLLARAALSLYWWNPLAWLAWREFVKESERAADDLVLRAGARASDYAGHLLEIARSLQSAPMTASAAVAMARPSQLEGRLLAILDGRIRRSTAGRYAPVAAAVLAIALVAPFAALQAQNKPAPPEMDATIRAANAQKNHEILDRAARAYEELHKYAEAQTLLETALAIRAERSGQQSVTYAAGLVKLGDLAVKRRQYAEADLFYAKAISLGDRPEVAGALLYLGKKAHGQRNNEAASEFFQRTLNADPKGPSAGPALTWMAMLRLDQPDAELLFQRALAVEEPDSAETATTLELYSLFLSRHGRGPESEQMRARASQIRGKRGEAPPASTAFRVGGGVTAPKLLKKVEPEYSEEARAAKYQGTVLLDVEISPEGHAENIRVERSLGFGLDEKAIEAVRQWQFQPGFKGEIAVPVKARIELNFRLQ